MLLLQLHIVSWVNCFVYSFFLPDFVSFTNSDDVWQSRIKNPKMDQKIKAQEGQGLCVWRYEFVVLFVQHIGYCRCTFTDTCNPDSGECKLVFGFVFLFCLIFVFCLFSVLFNLFLFVCLLLCKVFRYLDTWASRHRFDEMSISLIFIFDGRIDPCKGSVSVFVFVYISAS